MDVGYISGLKVIAAYIVIATTIAFSAEAYRGRSSNISPSEYATWPGLGPDKWSSVWLVEKYINPGNKVTLVPLGSRPTEYTLFDIPGSTYYRSTTTSTFSLLAEKHDIDDPYLERLINIIHDIEINMWLPDADPLSGIVEASFRNMQNRYDRVNVPHECYISFFDNVLVWLKSSPEKTRSDISPSPNCGREIETGRSNRAVSEVSISNLFDLMRSGRKVHFIDVREEEEFLETHIPGATNLQIRNATKEKVASLPAASLYIAYCVKDFRGYEMAKKLQILGKDNVAILNPYGLNGWISKGLPVTKKGEVNDNEGLLMINDCISRSESCRGTM